MAVISLDYSRGLSTEEHWGTLETGYVLVGNLKYKQLFKSCPSLLNLQPKAVLTIVIVNLQKLISAVESSDQG